MHVTRINLGRDLLQAGWISAAIMAVLTTAWVVALALIPGPPGDAALVEKLRYLGDHPETAIGPGLVAGLALLHVPVWLGLAAAVWARRPAAGLFGVVFGLVYAPLALMNYWAQLTVVRGLADVSRTDPVAAAAAYRLFEFPGGLASFTYGVDVLAYVVWGVAAIAVCVGLVALEGRLAQTTALLWGIGGVLAIVGGIGFLAQNDVLELGVLLSGVVFLVGLVATSVLLQRAASTEDAVVGSLSLELRVGPNRA
jgi:hypothetical protein